MRVLLLEPNLADNGALRVSLDRATRWAAAGDAVRLVTMYRGHRPTPAAKSLGLTYVTTGRQRLLLSLPAALWRLVQMARASDIVVAGREIDHGLLLGRLASAIARKPFVVTVHANIDRAVQLVPPRERAVTRWVLRHSDAAVLVAEDLIPGLVALGVRAERLHVVRNGVDVGAIRQAGLAPSPVPLPDTPFVVSSGRLAEPKGFDLLVRAHAAALAGGAPRHHLVIIGEGPDRGDLESLVHELGVADTVLLPGFVGNPHAVVSRADLFVQASRWEGFPLALAEALSVGAPCLATACVAGPREILDGGAFGQLVPPEDVDALAVAITAHLRDPGSLRERGARGGAEAPGRFDPQTAADRHRAVLRSLVVEDGREDTVSAGRRLR